MSSLARWSYKEGPATVWPYTLDEYSQPVYDPPFVIEAVDYELGGEVARDQNGDEFVPRLTIYFEQDASMEAIRNQDPTLAAAFVAETYELDYIVRLNLEPKRDWYVKLGDHSDLREPPKDAERIRSITKWPMSKFGANEIPDWKMMA